MRLDARKKGVAKVLLQHAKNRRGSTLLMVIIVFALLLVFGMAALTLSANASRNAVTDYQTQQAYFTARSAVLAAVDYVKTAPDPKALLDSLDGKTSDKTIDPQMGEYTLTVNKLDETHYELISNAEVDGKTRQMSVILSIEGDSGFPFGQNLVTTTKFNGVNSKLSGGAEVFGNVMINDAYAIPDGVKVYGDVYTSGSVTMSGGAMVYKDDKGHGGNLYSAGNLTLRGGVTLKGSLYCEGDMILDGGTVTMDNSGVVYVKGKLSNTSWTSISTPNDIIVWKNGNFKGWMSGMQAKSNKIHFGETLSGSRDGLSLVVIERFSPEANGHTMPNMSFVDAIPELDKLIKPEYNIWVNSWKGNILNLNAGSTQQYVLSQSGTLNSLVGRDNKGTLIIDTSRGDVNLYITQTTMSNKVFKQWHTRVTGPNQLILHLAPGVKFNHSDYTSLGLTDSNSEINENTKPKVCIIAPYADNTITLSAGASMAAYIIMPYGDMTVGGDAIYSGNMIVGSSQMGWGAKLYYQTPNYPKIPGIGDISVGGDGTGGGAGGGVSLVGVYTTRGE